MSSFGSARRIVLDPRQASEVGCEHVRRCAAQSMMHLGSRRRPLALRSLWALCVRPTAARAATTPVLRTKTVAREFLPWLVRPAASFDTRGAGEHVPPPRYTRRVRIKLKTVTMFRAKPSLGRRTLQYSAVVLVALAVAASSAAAQERVSRRC